MKPKFHIGDIIVWSNSWGEHQAIIRRAQKSPKEKWLYTVICDDAAPEKTENLKEDEILYSLYCPHKKIVDRPIST